VTSRASLLLQSITDPVVSFDARWRYTYVNAAAESFLNRGRESLLGHVCWEIFPHWREQENARWVRRAMAERRTVVWEACSTPAKVWMQWRCYPVQDGGVSVVAQNIDERVRAAAALQSDAEQARCDGRAAIEGVPHSSPDVVLMDISMPRLNGEGATLAIKAGCPGNCGMAKLALENRADIVRFALQQGWLKDA
jgi:PAS domain S-box-containing protein